MTNWLENLTKLCLEFWVASLIWKEILEAERILKENPQIEELVGHSQAGVVALQLANDFPETYEQEPTTVLHFH